MVVKKRKPGARDASRALVTIQKKKKKKERKKEKKRGRDVSLALVTIQRKKKESRARDASQALQSRKKQGPRGVSGPGSVELVGGGTVCHYCVLTRPESI